MLSWAEKKHSSASKAMEEKSTSGKFMFPVWIKPFHLSHYSKRFVWSQFAGSHAQKAEAPAAGSLVGQQHAISTTYSTLLAFGDWFLAVYSGREVGNDHGNYAAWEPQLPFKWLCHTNFTLQYINIYTASFLDRVDIVFFFWDLHIYMSFPTSLKLEA